MIRGYAALFNVRTEWDDLPNEVLDPRCFRRLPRTVPVYLNHRRRIGTARVWVDRRGLRFELPGHKLPRNFTGCSITFYILRVRNLNTLYRVTEADLEHIALCTEPVSYPQTKATVKEVSDDRR